MTLLEDKKIESGFTLLELLIILSMISIGAAITIPNLSGMSASFNRLNAKSYVVQDLKRAQAHTITQGCRGIVTISASGTSYSYGCDYLAYDTSDPPAADSTTFVRNLPPHTKIATSDTIIFNSRGQAVDADDILSNRTVTFYDTSSGADESFATGTLLGTGVFTIE